MGEKGESQRTTRRVIPLCLCPRVAILACAATTMARATGWTAECSSSQTSRPHLTATSGTRSKAPPLLHSPLTMPSNGIAMTKTPTPLGPLHCPRELHIPKIKHASPQKALKKNTCPLAKLSFRDALDAQKCLPEHGTPASSSSSSSSSSPAPILVPRSRRPATNTRRLAKVDTPAGDGQAGMVDLTASPFKPLMTEEDMAGNIQPPHSATRARYKVASSTSLGGS